MLAFIQHVFLLVLLGAGVISQNTADVVRSALDTLTIPHLDDVRGNIFLPLNVNGFDFNITWDSSNISVIASNGIVHRQPVDTNVTLCASVNYDGTTSTRELTATVPKAYDSKPFEGYVFAYFTGNSIAGEQIYFAASEGNDALHWSELNGGQPVLRSTLGTKGLRDPFIIRSPEGDTFYLIATDLSIGSGTSWDDSVRIGSRYLEVWESHDLKTWSAQRHVLVSPATAGNTWAPEAYYDTDLGAYVVFWASSLYPENDLNHTTSTYHRMLYATTRDFVTFSDPQIWQDAGMSRIDSTVISINNVYYRFTKDEGASGTGCTDIIQESSDSLLARLPSWKMIDSCIGKKAGTSAVEGPTSFQSNPGDVNGQKVYLFVDEYSNRGYIPLETADISKPAWKVSSSYALPKSPRHGTVLAVTAAELASLKADTLVPKDVDEHDRVKQRSDNLAIDKVSLTDISTLKVAPVVDESLYSVLFPVVPGTDMETLAPTFVTADGVTSLPPSGAVVDLSSTLTYELSQGNVVIGNWTMKAIEMGSPVLPGLYADPNIAVFGSKYYIYATTDGFVGWGGNVFYAWTSNDLVTWKRGGTPFLTLNGTDGNVPWASGNAWAPTITERFGKYYFYFSGHNPTYDRKTIGVAVGDNPEGPFIARSTAMILNNEVITSGQAIDPDAFLDPVTGKYYLLWGNGKPLLAELNTDMISINWKTAQQITGLVDFREGLFIVYRAGQYHLTYSIDDTGSENYRVGYATSSKATGPWTYRGVILQKDVSQGILGTGHNSILNVPGTDDWYIAYHRFAIPGGGGYRRETTIDRLTFDSGTGLIQRVVPTLTSVKPQPIQ